MTRALLLLLVAAPSLAAPPPGVSVDATRPAQPAAPTVLGGGVRLDELQREIAKAKLDGWLLADWRGRDDIAVELVRPRGAPSRRWFFLVPAAGAPTMLAFRAELEAFEAAPGRKTSYASWRELPAALRVVLRGMRRVAMNHSPSLPSLARVDAGLIELVRGAGVAIVPSGDLVTFARARWSERERATHLFAMRQLEALKDEAFRSIADAVAQGRRLSERDLAQRLAEGIRSRGLETEVPPSVTFGARTSDPRHRPSPRAEVRRGDVVLIDLAARQAAVPDGAVYAAGTWVGFVGDAIPERVTSAFSAARTARDEAIALLRERQKKGAPVRGFEIDARVREALAAAGFAGAPPHASGHSLDRHRFGDGPDLDDLETHDDRLLLARTGYAIAPGVYAPGEFGVRTGVCVFLGDGGVEVTVEKPQQAIERIGAPVEKKVEPAPPPKPPVTPPPVEKPKAPQPDDAKKAPKE